MVIKHNLIAHKFSKKKNVEGGKSRKLRVRWLDWRVARVKFHFNGNDLSFMTVNSSLEYHIRENLIASQSGAL